MKRNPLLRLLRNDPKHPTEHELLRRLAHKMRLGERFAKFANSPTITWESDQQRELAFIGGILAQGTQGDQSIPMALALLPTLRTLSDLTPEKAMSRGRMEWKNAMDRLAWEVTKIGQPFPADNVIFSTERKRDAHRN